MSVFFYVDLQNDNYYAVRLPEADKGGSLSRTGRYSTKLCSYILEDIDGGDLNKMADICSRERLLRELAGKNEHLEVEFRHKHSVLWLRMEIHLVSAENDRPKTVIIAFRNIR